MTGRQKKTTKRLAWLLTLFLVISAILPQPMQAAVSSQTGQVVMEGIRLSKTSLVMKTGESKTLTVSFLPENTTEQPDVIWSSDDTDVVQVTQDGKTATVTAPEGEGGTAVIKGWNLYCHLPGTCDRTGADAGKYGIYAEQFRKQPL